MASDRKVMVAVDDSEISAYAFTWALYNLIRENDHIVVLNVAPFVGMNLPSPDLASVFERLLPVLLELGPMVSLQMMSWTLNCLTQLLDSPWSFQTVAGYFLAFVKQFVNSPK
eukprot:Gb_12734 [translate_table: standard]